jgi:hypothetical protein
MLTATLSTVAQIWKEPSAQPQDNDIAAPWNPAATLHQKGATVLTNDREAEPQATR